MNRVKSMAKFKFINLRIAQHHVWLWILAFLITAGSAVYQRMTGPTYPYRGKATIGENKVSFKLIRSETVNINAEIKLTVPDTAVSGYLRYRRYKSHDEWSNIPMERDGDHLTAYLPHQNFTERRGSDHYPLQGRGSERGVDPPRSTDVSGDALL
jgi:hypothetical protein